MTDNESISVKRWYAIQTTTGKEHEVAERMKKSIQSQNMEDRFGEILVPTEEVVEMKAGQKHRSERKFFPGYVWVEMIMDPQTWHLVKAIRGVISFVGGKNPAPIPESQVKAIKRQVHEGVQKPRPKILYEVGEMVRIISGPFVDFNGVVEDVNYEKNRLRVSVLIFGRSTPVELEFSQVEKVT